MTTERTGALPPDHGRGATDTKAAREEKQKVEKVREIDADEETQRRRKKFQMMMGDEDLPVDLQPRAPSPFETEFYATATPAVEPGSSAAAGSMYSGTPSLGDDLGDVEDSIVPSPSYSTPPDVSSLSSQAAPEDESESDDLPQSSDFWEDIDLPPDQPLQQPQMQETPQSQARTQPAIQQTEEKVQPAAKQQKVQPAAKQQKGQQQKASPPSPLGPPGKPTPKAPAFAGPPGKKPVDQPAPSEKPPFFAPKGEKKGIEPAKKETFPSFEEKTALPPQKGAIAPSLKGAQIPKKDEEEEMPTSSYAGSLESPQQIPSLPPGRKESVKGKGKQEEPEVPVTGGIVKEGAAPYTAKEPETGGEGRGQRQGRESTHGVEIVSPSLPTLPPDIQPAAQTAATQAAPYLRPETMSLFYQMVGTVYVMTGPAATVTRTEIQLNNPAFADSKFYGATITIEKYAAAPDSFNIRLTGNDAAVTAFKDNIPSLMTAFQNGKFNFKINRVEAEYSTIKPVFRRREKGEEGGFGGDSRDRRK